MLWFSADCKEPKSPFVTFSQFNDLATGATVLTYSLPTTQKSSISNRSLFLEQPHRKLCYEHEKVTRWVRNPSRPTVDSLWCKLTTTTTMSMWLFVQYRENHVRIFLCSQSWSLIILATDARTRRHWNIMKWLDNEREGSKNICIFSAALLLKDGQTITAAPTAFATSSPYPIRSLKTVPTARWKERVRLVVVVSVCTSRGFGGLPRPPAWCPRRKLKVIIVIQFSDATPMDSSSPRLDCQWGASATSWVELLFSYFQTWTDIELLSVFVNNY